jgi:hypothetical protein
MKKFGAFQKRFNRETGKSRLQQTSSTQRKVVYVEEIWVATFKIQVVYVSSYMLRQLSNDLGLKMQGVKGITRECGKACIGQTDLPLRQDCKNMANTILAFTRQISIGRTWHSNNLPGHFAGH